MTTPTDHVEAVTRELRTVERDGQQLNRLIATRRFRGTIGDVWDALTNPERLPRWFLPVSGDLKVGGRYQFEGNAGGEVLACTPPEQFSVTWEFGGGVSYLQVALAADSDPGRTLLTLTHDGTGPPEFFDQFGPGALGIGWELGFRGLAEHLPTGDVLDPAAAEAWATSPDGVAVVAAISAAWGEVSVAFGTDPEQARSAAENCTAFYTTVPPEN